MARTTLQRCNEIDKRVKKASDILIGARLGKEWSVLFELCSALHEVTAVLRSGGEPKAYNKIEPHEFAAAIGLAKAFGVCWKCGEQEEHPLHQTVTSGFVRVYTTERQNTVLLVNGTVLAEGDAAKFGRKFAKIATRLSEELGLDLVRG